MFLTLPLEIPDKAKLHPQIFRKIVLATPHTAWEFPRPSPKPKTKTPGNSA